MFLCVKHIDSQDVIGETVHSYHIEASPEAVAYALANDLPYKYYLIEFDEFGVPSLVAMTDPLNLPST